MMMNLKDAIGPNHLAQARRTVPGLLAAALNEFLYAADVKKADTPHQVDKLIGYAELRRATNGEQPWNAKSWVKEDGKIDTVAMLRECRDYLEVLSFREVID